MATTSVPQQGPSAPASPGISVWKALARAGRLAYHPVRSQRLEAELFAGIARLEVELTSPDAAKKEFAQRAKPIFDRAMCALKEGRIDAAWVAYDEGRRYIVQGFSAEQIAAKANELRAEAAKLNAWRQQAVYELLGKVDQPKAVAGDTLREAMRVRDEYLQNIYFKIGEIGDKLQLSNWVTFCILGLLLILSYNNIFLGLQWPIVVLTMLMGALGGAVSSLISTTPKVAETQHSLLLIGALTAARPVLGAASALLIMLFLKAGLLNYQSAEDSPLSLSIAFAAGFTDKILLGAVTGVAGSSQKT